MRVAVLAHSFPRFPGDTHGPFVLALCEALAGLGHEVHALVPYDPALALDPRTAVRVHSFRYAWPDRFHLLGYSRTLRRDVGMKLGAWIQSPLYFAFAERALHRLVIRERIDLIHAHWVLPNGYIAARVAARAGLPLAVTLHGSDVFMAERNPIFRHMARVAVERAAHVTSCSADLRDRLLLVAGARHGDRILLVPNGTDPLGSAPPRASVLPLDPGERRIVAVGRLVDKKGFRYLIQALPAIAAKVPRARLVLGGGGDLEPALRAEAQGLGVTDRIHFTGGLSHDQVLALVASAEVFVMPSVRDAKGNIDGLPIVVLEAMAAGKPVVASDLAGMPLAVGDGVSGLLVPEKDPGALGQAVIDLLADPERAAAMGEKARARVRDDLNWAAVARTHDELYRQAVRVGPSPR
jgi:glycosyltransferase involved in cell wall biosynthesis